MLHLEPVEKQGRKICGERLYTASERLRGTVAKGREYTYVCVCVSRDREREREKGNILVFALFCQKSCKKNITKMQHVW